MRPLKVLSLVLIVLSLLLKSCTGTASTEEVEQVTSIPNVIGLYGDDAKDLATDAGVKPHLESTDGKMVIRTSKWVVVDQDPASGTEIEFGTEVKLVVSRPDDAREIRAVRLVVDELPDAPIWEGLTTSTTVVDEDTVCVDRTFGEGKAEDISPKGVAGYVIVSFPDETLGEPQDGVCADYVPAEPTTNTAIEHERECGSNVVLDSIKFVCAEDFEEWPLTVPDGMITCEVDFGAPYPVSFTDGDGNVYALNGTALDRTDLPAIDPIWADQPDVDGLKKDISPLIDAALSLCN